MTAVGVQDAASRLPHLIKLAAAGEQILITDGDQPVAVLGPPPQATATVPDARKLIAEMLAARDAGGPTLGPGLTPRDLIEDGRRF